MQEESLLSQESIDYLTTCTNSFKPLRLVIGVDIGGTNTRVAVLNLDDPKTYYSLIKFKADNGELLLNGLNHVSSQFIAITKTKPLSAVLDIAGPIQNDHVNVTNYKDKFLLKISDLPKDLFPENTSFINDLAATCEGIGSLNHTSDIQQYFQPLFGKNTDEKLKLKPENYIVLAMGTGLGCGMLFYRGNQGNYLVVPLESGHVQVTPSNADPSKIQEETDLFKFLNQKVYDGKFQIEWEDICSGRGLTWCYQFANKEDPKSQPSLTPFEVVQKYLNEKDEKAEKALFLHYEYLIRCAQQLCIGLNGKGVFLAGDNQVANDDFVSKYSNEYEKIFRNHTKGSWIENVPVFRQVKESNLNLLGCLYVANRNATKRSKTDNTCVDV